MSMNLRSTVSIPSITPFTTLPVPEGMLLKGYWALAARTSERSPNVVVKEAIFEGYRHKPCKGKRRERRRNWELTSQFGVARFKEFQIGLHNKPSKRARGRNVIAFSRNRTFPPLLLNPRVRSTIHGFWKNCEVGVQNSLGSS
ncbi:hypothetical protein L596_023216 [Steinernema carpocapsae]|uniref:Uncharacterized protein n=1 Tax=Steinernema carpocapsae TaxID=34508 RepID=A0A4U5MCZ2_STECR|nr:hypothetical protein L596_023216 [Steinernema carpocapsae]